MRPFSCLDFRNIYTYLDFRIEEELKTLLCILAGIVAMAFEMLITAGNIPH
jgi:hypothetical protein